MATDNTRKMREEITTLKQFKAIGSSAEVSKKYGVSLATAFNLKKQLTEKEKVEMSVIKAETVKMETTPFEIPNIPQNYEEINKLVEGREAPCGESKAQGIDNHTKEEVKGLETASTEIKTYPCYGTYDHNPNTSCRTCSQGKGCRHASDKGITEDRIYLGVLAEPEPTWTPEHAGGWSQIERKWTNLETELVLIRMLYKEQAVEEFEERLARTMRGMAV